MDGENFMRCAERGGADYYQRLPEAEEDGDPGAVCLYDSGSDVCDLCAERDQ